jgi:hypothetical protein
VTLQAPVLNAAVDGATALLAYASIHSANPGGTGASEIAGGSPAYARVACVWPGASGDVTTLPSINFNMPAGSTAAYVGFWSALSGGTWRGYEQLSAPESFTAQGVYALTSVTVTGS